MRFFANERSIYCNFENRKKNSVLIFFLWLKLTIPKIALKWVTFVVHEHV